MIMRVTGLRADAFLRLSRIIKRINSFFGIAAEYICIIYLETKSRLKYIIEKTAGMMKEKNENQYS